jgi:hypothetical protein
MNIKMKILQLLHKIVGAFDNSYDIYESYWPLEWFTTFPTTYGKNLF